MIIDFIDTSLEEIPLSKPYSIAYKTTYSIKTLLVKIVLKNGVYGLGGASVSKHVVGVDTQEAFSAAKDYQSCLVGKNISEVFKSKIRAL